ncbi:hypothetical protein [Euzebya rosea]|uniref:hypothetical protein n=1 Tax=Euzebya rosea TaxID=2052804 RepID=UPI0013008F40|nr:hypothetical protein [Euzebya rosea]
MSTSPVSPNARVLTSSSGVVVIEDGPLVVVADRRLVGPAVAAFVVGLVWVIAVGGMTAAAVTGDLPVPWPVALLAPSVVPLPILVLLLRALQAARRRPLDHLAVSAVFDRAAGALRDPQGRPIAPLTHVRVGRRVQVGSSSPALVVRMPDRTLVLARPSPFAGGMGNLDSVLAAAIGQPPR